MTGVAKREFYAYIPTEASADGLLPGSRIFGRTPSCATKGRHAKRNRARCHRLVLCLQRPVQSSPRPRLQRVLQIRIPSPDLARRMTLYGRQSPRKTASPRHFEPARRSVAPAVSVCRQLHTCFARSAYCPVLAAPCTYHRSVHRCSSLACCCTILSDVSIYCVLLPRDLTDRRPARQVVANLPDGWLAIEAARTTPPTAHTWMPAPHRKG